MHGVAAGGTCECVRVWGVAVNRLGTPCVSTHHPSNPPTPQSSLSPLLASPALSHVVLTDSSLTGLLSYGNSSSSSYNSSSDNSSDGSGGSSSSSGGSSNDTSAGSSGAAQPPWAGSCGALAPPGRRLLALSGNDLTGAVPDCLAAHAGLQELQLAMNLALTCERVRVLACLCVFVCMCVFACV